MNKQEQDGVSKRDEDNERYTERHRDREWESGKEIRIQYMGENGTNNKNQQPHYKIWNTYHKHWMGKMDIRM